MAIMKLPDYGSKEKMAFLQDAHPLQENEIVQIVRYTRTQNTFVQVWAFPTPKGLVMVALSHNQIETLARSSRASLIWDMSRDDTPRVCAHGWSAFRVAATSAQVVPMRHTIFLGVDYFALEKGKDATRSAAVEKMATEWIKDWGLTSPEKVRWIGALSGGAVAYDVNNMPHGRTNARHYMADVSVNLGNGVKTNVEVKGFCGRFPLIKNV